MLKVSSKTNYDDILASLINEIESDNRQMVIDRLTRHKITTKYTEFV